MAVIYKATNKINGKSYIGYATNFRKRFAVHKHNALVKNCDHLFHRAIRKYGFEAFEWEILHEAATLDDEIRLIEEHDTFVYTGHGYNLTKGGDGSVGWRMRDETKAKISEKAKGNKNCLGRVLSEETKAKIRAKRALQTNTTKGKPSPLKGRKQPKDVVEKRVASRMQKAGFKHSEETKQKISEKAKLRKTTEKQLEALRRNAQLMKERGHTDEAKAKISKAHKGKVISEEQRRKISLNHGAHNKDNYYYATSEYKEKMSKALKGKTRTPEQRERYRLAALKRYHG